METARLGALTAEPNERHRARSSPYAASGIGHALYEMALDLSYQRPENGASGPYEALPDDDLEVGAHRHADKRQALRKRATRHVEAKP